MRAISTVQGVHALLRFILHCSGNTRPAAAIQRDKPEPRK